MSTINVKILSDNAYAFLKQNIDHVTEQIIKNKDNKWIESLFPQPMFIIKKFEIEDFELENNPNSKNKIIDFENSLKIHSHLSQLPRFVLTDERFWLWLHFEKFYSIVREMMPIKNKSTVLDHWTHRQGSRRGLMFGVLSRCYFRIELTMERDKKNMYQLSKWIIEFPERFRNLTWRSFSSEHHLVRGVIRGQKRVIDKYPKKEKLSMYPIVAKYVSEIGGINLLDTISEDDIEELVYNKMLELI